jgi:hypothetical protein
MKKILLFSFLFILFIGCFKNNLEPYNPVVYRPIYQTRSEIEKVVFSKAQPLKIPGKIYIKDGYLFVNESGKGVHIFDNKDPKNPQKIAFYQIPGNVDIAIRGNILYADNGRDLLSIEVTNPKEAKLLNRMQDVFPNQAFPPFTGVNFECVDNSKGVVVGWEKVQNSINPYTSYKCYR